MKKPRKPSRRWTAEDHYLRRLYGNRKTHERPIHTVFPRLNSRHAVHNAARFRAAGYPSAICPDVPLWHLVHKWCGEHFRNKFGRTYSWTGHIFWFQTVEDRDRFVKHFTIDT